MSLATIIIVLQAALSLLNLVSSSPQLPQSVRDQATQVAQQAVIQATTALSTNGMSTVMTSSNVSDNSNTASCPLIAYNHSCTAGQHAVFSDGSSYPHTSTSGGVVGCDQPTSCVVSQTQTACASYTYTSVPSSDPCAIYIPSTSAATSSASCNYSITDRTQQISILQGIDTCVAHGQSVSACDPCGYHQRWQQAI